MDEAAGVAVHCLSTNMTMSHRDEVLANIQAELAAGVPTIVVSTSLIEAGVDLSFAFVMRALAGLDSIMQAAGRSNRDGNLDKGLALVFELAAGGDFDFDNIEDGLWLRSERMCSEQIVGHDFSTFGTNDVKKYLESMFFCQHGWNYEALSKLHDRVTDRKLVRNEMFPRSIDFAKIAKEVKIIKDGTECLVVPRDAEGLATYNNLVAGISCNVDSCSVAVWCKQAVQLVEDGYADEFVPGVFAIKPDFVDKVYDDFGLRCELGELRTSEDMAC
jgi:hypothetical protein